MCLFVLASVMETSSSRQAPVEDPFKAVGRCMRAALVNWFTPSNLSFGLQRNRWLENCCYAVVHNFKDCEGVPVLLI